MKRQETSKTERLRLEEARELVSLANCAKKDALPATHSAVIFPELDVTLMMSDTFLQILQLADNNAQLLGAFAWAS